VNFWEHIRFFAPGWRDVVQIVIVAVVIYRLLLFLAGTRALQILVGLIILGAVYVAAVVLRFQMITTLLGVIFAYGAFALLVVFQPELRHALARLGRSRAITFLTQGGELEIAAEIAEAAERLSRNGTGALIAIEGEVSLNEVVQSGTEMRATVSADLLTTIFTPYSPMHDGAVIVRRDQIVAAGCVLPLTQFPVADKSLGTRHRAALGLCEETDAIVIVVSEETSKISIASRGALQRGVTPEAVRASLAGRRRPALSLQASTSDTPIA